MADAALITRRAALKALPAVGVSLVLSTATVEAMPSIDEPELPHDKVMRLAWELADALNEYADQSFHAIVYPSDKRGDWSVGLFVTDRCTNNPSFSAEEA